MKARSGFLLLAVGFVIAGYLFLRLLPANTPRVGGPAPLAGTHSLAIDNPENRAPMNHGDPHVVRDASNNSSTQERRTHFLETQRCYSQHEKLSLLSNQLDCKALAGRPGLEKQYADCLNNVVAIRDRVSAIEAEMTGCAPRNAITRAYYDATKAAARNGDADAKLCYLQSAFSDDGGDFRYTDTEVAEYKATAPTLIAEAFARGDWRIVSLLSLRRMSPAFGLAANIEGIGSAETVYRMDTLLMLGADDDYGSTVRALRDSIPTTGDAVGQYVTADAIASAQDWARRTYEQSFAGSPRLTRRPTVCGAEQ